jgi:hypothetical protein
MNLKTPTPAGTLSKWSRETIYRPEYLESGPMPPRVHPLDGPESEAEARRIYSPEFYNALLIPEESTWIDPECHLIQPEIDILIAGGECPLCSVGLDWRRQRGDLTGITVAVQVGCDCERHIRTGKQWRAMVPPKFQGSRFSILKPYPGSRLPMATQAQYIKSIQQNRTCSHLFGGDAGTTKTTFGYALLFEALERANLAAEQDPDHQEPCCFWVRTSTLLEQIHLFQLAGNNPENAEVPTITAQRIIQLGKKGIKVFLGLDELEKVGRTENRLNNLHDLIMACNDWGGQIVGMANLTAEALRAKWKDFSGDAIIMRLTSEEHNGRYLEFKAVEKTQPKEKK